MGAPLDFYRPTVRAHSVCDIPLSWLRRNDIRLALLDLDNCMVDWGTMTIDATRSAHVMEWVQAGIIVCLVSNTYSSARVKKLAESMGGLYWTVPGWRFDRWKPSPHCLEEAMSRFSIHPSNTAMIGDQLSDVLAARRARCKERILVDPTSPRCHVSTRWFKLRKQRKRFAQLEAHGLLPEYFKTAR